MLIDLDDLPLMGTEVDISELHSFYPLSDINPAEPTPSICPFEGDTHPLTQVIEYMELDTRYCPVTSVIKPSDFIAGIW